MGSDHRALMSMFVTHTISGWNRNVRICYLPTTWNLNMKTTLTDDPDDDNNRQIRRQFRRLVERQLIEDVRTGVGDNRPDQERR